MRQSCFQCWQVLFLFDTYNLSTSSLGCSALCMVISFLVFRSICLSSSLAHFYYFYFYLLIRVFFFRSTLADGLHWSLSDSKSHQVSRTLLSMLAVLNNAVVWMVSARSPISKSSRPFNNPLVTVPKAPITIGIIFSSMFHYHYY